MIAGAEPAEALRARVDAACAARARLRARPLRATIDALAAAAARWRTDAPLRADLPTVARLSSAMIEAVLPAVAATLDADGMTALVEAELGSGAAKRPAPDGPALIAHVLASNVPALALPAIALGCLAGAAVLVKSGRADPLSAAAFQRALAAVDPELAATVVPTYWRGGEAAVEAAVLGHADVVVATGGDAAVAALRSRVHGRFVTHGPRLSAAAVPADACDAAAIARDVVLYDQRGCLSPHAVYIVGGDARAAAERLAAALDALDGRLPRGPRSAEERAVWRVFRESAEWESGASAFGRTATVLYERRPGPVRPTCGDRTVRVHALRTVAELPRLLPPGAVECVALAGTPSTTLAADLVERGVARVCRPGRMQEPGIAWPRGQLAPLGALLGRPGPPRLEVET